MRNFTRVILNFFLQGLLFVVPIVVTGWVLIKTILWIDSLLPFQIPVKVPLFNQIDLPGLGLIVIFLFVTIVGYIGSKYIRNPFFAYTESVIDRAPLVKLIYSSVKDLINAFVGEKKSFNHPVLVQIHKENEMYRIGFITKDDLSMLGLEKDKVAVYLPFSYGFNGQLMIVKRENVTPIDASGTEMMKFIISGGVTEL